MQPQLTIRLWQITDIPNVVASCVEGHMPKSLNLFNNYWQEYELNERLVWLAFIEMKFAGYITLKWCSAYQDFFQRQIPEIMDFNVLPVYRRHGIGKALLATAEQSAFTKSNIVGLGVGLYDDADGGYGPAHKLYIQSGYLPTGQGITYKGQVLDYGDQVILDDYLILWLSKKQNYKSTS